MAEQRTRYSSPKPWRQFEARTSFLRVPADDWPSVRQGRKTEFRATGARHMTQMWNVTCPMPVVGYAFRRAAEPDSALLVLEATWREPIGAISPESLEREGFPDIAHFRRYWMERYKRRFAPMQTVQVYRVRPAARDDLAILGLKLIEKLYGEHLPT
jgi:hypothetical protein